MNYELAHSVFEYRDGDLYWKSNPNARTKDGTKAGFTSRDGYIHTDFQGKQYRNHRIIFLMHHGYIPAMIDHIDGNRANNRIENLRICNNTQNLLNSKTPKSNTSGLKNVEWRKQRQKWQVKFKVNKVVKYFGLYDDLELAELVAIEARNKYHGEFAKHF